METQEQQAPSAEGAPVAEEQLAGVQAAAKEFCSGDKRDDEWRRVQPGEQAPNRSNLPGTPGGRSYYKRPLPPPATAFSSAEGRRIFHEALCNGSMEGYFLLAEQFRTQDEPAFCGLSTLTMVLNALGVDPLRTWKGPWRWYHESMLDCCRPLSWVKKSGLLFAEVVCLSECHGLDVDAKHPETAAGDATERWAGGENGGQVPESSSSAEVLIQPCPSCEQKRVQLPQQHGLAEFRADIEAACRSVYTPLVIVSYSRKLLHQTGDGHFSPIAGYNEGSDCVLILDTARFKYPPHWVPIEQLYKAMQPIDPSSGTSRGWIVVRGVLQAAERVVRVNEQGTCCGARFFLDRCGGERLSGMEAESECNPEVGREGGAVLETCSAPEQTAACTVGIPRDRDMLVEFLAGAQDEAD